MSYPSVAVVILSWNGRNFLKQFLPQLLQSTYPNVQFYIADNASTDDTVPFVSANFPAIKIIRLEQNSGFAEGYNLALRRVQADYYVLLNQDVEVTPGWIEPVIALMEKDLRIAVCQPKIRAFHNKKWFEYAGAAGGFLDKHGYAFCRGRFFQTTEMDTGQYDTESEIVWATGACLFIRSRLFHSMGGFDADFFAHFEEIDLCWRIKNAGYSIRYCPHSIVYHVGGGSLPQGNPKKTYLNFRNNLSMLVKNLPPEKLLPTVISRYLLDIVTEYKLLLSGNGYGFAAILRAHFYFLTHIGMLLAKRKKSWQAVEQNKIASPNRKAFYNGSIIWDYFIRNVRSFSGLAVEKFCR
ncbi:MAG TPA: glycosyltransferase family 2 protein [Chitinophagales bacterium]|nr:glycosyltransferase family 2 protein [Chitinophagales bacterium]